MLVIKLVYELLSLETSFVYQSMLLEIRVH